MLRHLNPHLERDTFSGGTNTTRRERNLRRVDEAARSCYFVKIPQMLTGQSRDFISCSSFTAALLSEKTVPGTGATRLGRNSSHPAVREWWRNVRNEEFIRSAPVHRAGVTLSDMSMVMKLRSANAESDSRGGTSFETKGAVA